MASGKTRRIDPAQYPYVMHRLAAGHVTAHRTFDAAARGYVGGDVLYQWYRGAWHIYTSAGLYGPYRGPGQPWAKGDA